MRIVGHFGNVVGVTSAGRLLTVDTFQNGNLVNFNEIGLYAPSSLASHFSIELPRGATFGEVRLAPDGKRLAWLLFQNNAPPRFLEKLYSVAGLNSSYSGEFWISKMNRKDMHAIGHIKLTAKDEGIHSLKWTPDGGRLSFLCKGDLWTVSAD